MTPTVRFAPSPTGYLHVGNARVALINWLFARANGGRFLLRIDDTDLERSRPEFEQAIREDLTWLGLSWDFEEHQSKRLDTYVAAAGKLKSMGRLYACFETPEELDGKRKRQLARGLPPVYDRAALSLTPEQVAAFEAEGRKPHWRFKLDHAEVRWDDLVRGPCHYQAAAISDPVLLRGDGTFLYTLCSVVDDAELAVTHVIRGEDHATNTAAQIQIFEALGAAVPAFAHLPLLIGAGGIELSKRLGTGSLRELQAAGIEPMALNAMLAKLGTSDPVVPQQNLQALVDNFELSHFGRATPTFDAHELELVNTRLLHEMAYDAGRLAPLGVDERLWLAVRGNLAHLAEAADWAAVAYGDITPVVEDAELLAAAAPLLPAEPWDETTWSAWTSAVKDATGRKGKGLFHPLRLALTGRETGPELKTLLPLIGRDRALARLSR